MKIYELRLKNCKSYTEKTISFQEGINFISGVNGAGKTTIIEAIGFVLFNHLPYSAGQFVREGKNSGEIQALVEAKDERRYRIIRKFNKSSKSLKWEVYDEETGAALDELHGGDDVARWIKESIGIDPADRLETIFEQVIAVPQGLFAAPFLETTTNRKKRFDEILKVEGYRQAFEKSRALKAYIEGDEKQIQTVLENLAVAIEEIPILEDQAAKKREEKQEKMQGYQDAVKRKDALEAKEQKLAQLKETKDAKETEKKILEQKRLSLNENIGSLSSRKEEAKIARQIVEGTSQGYHRYEENQKERRTWEEKKKQKDAMTAKLEIIEKAYVAEEKGIEVEKENILAREKELNQKVALLEQDRKNEEDALAARTEDFLQIGVWMEETEDMKKPFDELGQWISGKRRQVNDHRYDLQGIEDLKKQRVELKERSKDLPQREKEYTEVAALLAQGEELAARKSALQARKEELEHNRAKLAEGLCPIIQDPCPSHKVAGDLRGYFSNALSEIEEALAYIEDEQTTQKNLKRTCEKLKTALDLAHNDWAQLQTLEQDIEKKLLLLRGSIERIPVTEVVNLLHEGQSKDRAIESYATKIKGWADEKTLVEQAPYPYKNLANQAPLSLVNEVQRMPLETYEQMKDWIIAWEQASAGIEEWTEKEQQEAASFGQWQKDLLHAVGGKRQETKQQLDFTVKSLREHAEQMAEVEKKKEALIKRNKSLALTGVELAALKNELLHYRSVEETLTALNVALQSDQEAYEKFRMNFQIASKLEELEQQFFDAETQRRKITQGIEDAARELEKIASQYDMAEHDRLKSEAAEVKTVVTELKFYLQQLNSDMEQIQERLVALQKKKEEWEDKKKKLAIKQKAKELIQLIRDTLKNAADPIAHVYRRHLSIQANEIYRQVSNENVKLEWASEYELQLEDFYEGKERIRVFKQLSGGEQMTAALAVRLAMIKMLSDIRVGFFDEPTTNLDTSRRQNLALAIQNATRSFDQLFVISHDDAFDTLTENVLSLEKDEGDGTQVSQG